MLSSLQTVKMRTRRSSRRVRESCEATIDQHSLRRKSSHRRNQIYNIEVIEEEVRRVKVHYTGYSSQYDEWIRRSQIMYKPVRRPSTPNDEQSIALLSLSSQIKQKLIPSRKVEDPAVRIQLPFSRTAFELLRRQGESWSKSRTGNHTYTIRQYSDFNELLGEQWFMRVTFENL